MTQPVRLGTAELDRDDVRSVRESHRRLDLAAESIDRLRRLVTECRVVVAEVCATDSLPTSTSFDRPGGSGGISDPVGSTAARAERARSGVARVDELIVQASDALTGAARRASTIVGAFVPPIDAGAPGSGTCEGCLRWVPGTATDRIKAGWCPRCHRAWCRAGRPDRSEFARGRRIGAAQLDSGAELARLLEEYTPEEIAELGGISLGRVRTAIAHHSLGDAR